VNRVALVTGSAGGIGRAILLGLAAQGYDVVVHYRHSADRAEDTRLEAAQLGVRAIKLAADITDPRQAQHLVDKVVDNLGSLAILVNNVGDYLKKPVDELTIDEWQAMLNSNLNAPFYLTQAALPYLKQGQWGRIINLGFAGAQHLVARSGIVPYTIAKTGMILYSRALARRLAQHGITVNVVAPGVAETSVSQPLDEIPMGRLATVEELAQAVLYFVNQPYVTGQVLEVAGGWNL
jgi:3-oxoacyl-[acyl-carrier protein] reductase